MVDWGEVVAVAVPTVTILGGLIHVVFRLGRLTEKVEGLTDEVDDLKTHVWPTPVWMTGPRNPVTDSR